MTVRILFTIFMILCFHHAFGQMKLKDWYVEAEDAASKVTLGKDGAIDIVAPKGLTLWNRQLMKGNTIIEYDARIVVEDGRAEEWNRLSDLNCFWMASDPSQKYYSVVNFAKKGKGVFANQYRLQMYYMGYGGNHNSTTRFRRYDGDVRGIGDAVFRPAIIREYTDAENLLKANHWYHIRLEQIDGRVRYIIDGKCLVDYVDLRPLTTGYFGFRTTLAHAQVRNFCYTYKSTSDQPIALSWIGGGKHSGSVTFGVPFAKGEIYSSDQMLMKTDGNEILPHDEWTLAKWPDGSVKWKAVAAVVPETGGCTLEKSSDKNKKKTVTAVNNKYITFADGARLYVSEGSGNVVDSIVGNDGTLCTGKIWLEANGRVLKAKNVTIEQQGRVRSTIKVDGDCFTLRLYAYKGSNRLKVVHTLNVDSMMNANGLSSLGLRIDVPMSSPDHLRTVSMGDMIMPVKPLVSRRQINVDEKGEFLDERSETLAAQLASWDGFRLSQLSPNAYSIRKRATSQSPWIGTMEGGRGTGMVRLADGDKAVAMTMTDFWQSYPSTLQVDNARSGKAIVTAWMWSPEAEKMMFEHYDTIAHGLEASYEDVQPGMSTARGIARTSTLLIDINVDAKCQLAELTHEEAVMMPSMEYLHAKRAFGVWSLDKDSSPYKATLDSINSFYRDEIEKRQWYGYFNYGDVMHTYDGWRCEWRYDVGGFAWDNTELGSNAMLWMYFLRTGKADAWRMAVAMSRHTGEVDCYHEGPFVGLGSRHNVLHWGCGAKEARISQAYWNRFLYYLTADERSGDLMHEVVDADTLLYNLDPMRLAQPRSEKYPCTAPARLRIGPDWIAYAGNWFTEWERTGNRYYYDKIMAGIKSIVALPYGLFSGPKALGYDPATGIITWEGDKEVQHTNHLATIMGGFEMMTEMLMSINYKPWDKAWLEYAKNYRVKADTISHNHFPVPRLNAFAYWQTGDCKYRNLLDNELRRNPFPANCNYSTNTFATWTLDAIFAEEIR